jgi:hypothetical protein
MSILGSKANGDILFSGSELGKYNVMDDDERFIFEDQAKSQEGGQPLRRLEDIVGEIRKDLIKAHNSGNPSNHEGPDGNQFYDEKDLDS